MNIKQIVSLITALGAWLSLHGAGKYFAGISDPGTQDLLTLIVTLIVNHFMHGNPTPPDTGASPSKLCANLFILLALPALLFTGCSTGQIGTAYKVETATDTTIATAMSIWGDYVKANHPPVSEELQVQSAFQKVQAAELLANSATTIAAQNVGNTNLLNAVLTSSAAETQAFTDLVTLLQSFGVKL